MGKFRLIYFNKIHFRINQKVSKNKIYKKQNGGNATLCTTSLINSADGYGYVPPVGCIPVPIVSDPNAQGLAIESVHISATGTENAKYDNLIGK